MAPKTVNERILEAAIRHAHFIERLKAGEVNDVIALINSLLVPSLRSYLIDRLDLIRFNGRDPSPAAQRRVDAIRSFVRDQAAKATSEAWQLQKSSLLEIGQMETAWLGRAIVTALPTAEDTASELVVTLDRSGHSRAAKVIRLGSPTSSAIRHVLTQQPAQGQALSAWWTGLGRETAASVNRQIAQGLVEGDSTSAIVRRVIGTRAQKFNDGVLSTTRRHASAIVRTSVNHVSTQAREEAYKANDDLISGVQWVSTLDSNTTIICMSLDGQVFGVNQGRRPPAHHQCRSTTIPIIRPIAELIPSARVGNVPAGTRASFNGQVPAKLTYPEFLRRQSKSFQDEALGKGRADVFRRGKISIDRFVDDRGRPLSVRELIALEMRIAA